MFITVSNHLVTLVLSTCRVLATVLTIFLQCFLSAITSLSSASFIPVTSCISSIHFLLGRALLLLPSPYASIILFSSPLDRITCPKNPSFLLSAVCCSVSSSSIPISMRTLSFVFFSVHDILFIFLHIHISHALIFFSIFFVIVHISQPYRTVGKISVLIILCFVFMLTCLSRHNFSNPIIVAFPITPLRFIFLSHLPSFSTSDPRNVKLVTTFISSPSISKLSQMVVVFFMLKYRPAFSLSLFSLLISFFKSAFFPALNVVSSAYLKLFSVLPAIFTPSFASSISAFLFILSASGRI